jgi:dTDP-4-amino-4,6-dideoxygalactose transaminase
VEENWQRRHALWHRYLRELSGLPLTLPAPSDPGTRHALHLFTVLVTDDAPIARDGFIESLTREGIGVGVHYNSIPTHMYYRQAYGWAPEDYPESHRIGRQTVSLPLQPDLSEEEQDRVIGAVRRAVGW